MEAHGLTTDAPSSGGDIGLNIVLVVLDTVREKSVTPETMPTFCEIADSGTNFERAFSTAPWTLPSHASLFTGTYVSQHGTHGGNLYLHDTLRTVAESFSANGFQTIGVTNNTWITDEFGFARGFDHLHRGWQRIQSGVDIGSVVRADHLRDKIVSACDRLSDGNPVVTMANILHNSLLRSANDNGAHASIDWIEEWLMDREDGRPFFLFCNLIEPHIKYRPPKSFANAFLPTGFAYDDAVAIRQDPRGFDVGDYEVNDREFEALRGLYRGELAYVDFHLGRLRDALQAAGEWNRTVFVVCGDHGENIGEHGFFGHQYNLYENLLHVPLAITGGPFIDGGSRRDFVQLVDIPKTLLDVTGINDPEFQDQQQGHSLVTDGPDVRDAVIAEHLSPVPSPAQLADRYGSVPEHVWDYERSLRSIRTDDFKYIRGDDGHRELFRIAEGREGERSFDADRMEELDTKLEGFVSEIEGGRGAESTEISAATRDHLSELGYM